MINGRRGAHTPHPGSEGSALRAGPGTGNGRQVSALTAASTTRPNQAIKGDTSSKLHGINNVNSGSRASTAVAERRHSRPG